MGIKGDRGPKEEVKLAESAFPPVTARVICSVLIVRVIRCDRGQICQVIRVCVKDILESLSSSLIFAMINRRQGSE